MFINRGHRCLWYVKNSGNYKQMTDGSRVVIYDDNNMFTIQTIDVYGTPDNSGNYLQMTDNSTVVICYHNVFINTGHRCLWYVKKFWQLLVNA